MIGTSLVAFTSACIKELAARSFQGWLPSVSAGLRQVIRLAPFAAASPEGRVPVALFCCDRLSIPWMLPGRPTRQAYRSLAVKGGCALQGRWRIPPPAYQGGALSETALIAKFGRRARRAGLSLRRDAGRRSPVRIPRPSICMPPPWLRAFWSSGLQCLGLGSGARLEYGG